MLLKLHPGEADLACAWADACNQNIETERFRARLRRDCFITLLLSLTRHLFTMRDTRSDPHLGWCDLALQVAILPLIVKVNKKENTEPLGGNNV